MVRKKAAAMTLFICFAVILSASAGAITIEQANATPPEFSIYFYEPDNDLSGISLSEVSAYYDEQPMEVTGLQPASNLNDEIYYIYALDVSASINSGVFNAAKDAILGAYDKLGANEQMALITFGDSVETKLSGGESRSVVSDVLNSLSAKDMNTDFYGALNRIMDLSSQHGTVRNIGIIFSDGIDDIYAGFTRNELESRLRAGGVSINAMCVNGASSDAVSQFGEFARLSGGELFLFDDKDASSKLGALLARVDSCYALTLRSATNITDGKTHVITFTIGNLPTKTVEVAPTSWISENAAPTVTKVTYNGDELTLTIFFSKPVTGAADIGAFNLQNAKGTHIKLVSVTYSDEGGNPAAVLRLEETPYEGDYSLSFFGIKDISMEENALENATVTITLETGVKETPAWVYYLVIGGAIVVVAVIVTLLALAAKKKKMETETRFNQLENRPIIGQGTEAGNRIIIPKAQGIRIDMSIFDGKGKKYTVAPDIVTSLFIGKHAGNDLVLEDSRVSRQHAVMEKLENAIAIQDLNSTNGTFINGARIQPGISQRVSAGDEITLGDTTIRITSVG